ncbi:MAG: hypothetical protein JXA37_03550 [Chloroflexia bacterium]|nr:hypothetical protein [Chloroflexia bacterium]
MNKRIGLLIGFLAIVLLGAWLFLSPLEGVQPRTVSAGRLFSSFTTPRNLSNSGNPGVGENASQHVRAAIADDDYLHVGWMEGTLNSANGPAYVRGQGSTWPLWEWAGPSNNPGYVNPTLALDGNGTVHMVWTGSGGSPYEIYYAYKQAGGTWSGVANLSDDSNNSIYPVIAVDSQNGLWVVWETQITEQNFDVYVRHKPAGGTWGNTSNLSQVLGGQDLEPNIVIDANDVPHVVWRNNNSQPNWEIYYTKYVNSSWQTPNNISSNGSASHFPRIAANEIGDVFIVWEDEIDGADRFQTLFRRWDGSQWSSTMRVSSTPAKALWPAISAEGCNLYVVWTDYRNTSTETYFSHSTNCGSTWLGDENVSNNGSSSYYPEVVAQPGGFGHVFWQDYAPGQFDVYYGKGTIQLPATPTTPPTATPTFSPSPTFTPTPTPTSTPTPTPTSTPDPRPYGWVNIYAHEPYSSTQFTQRLDVAMRLWADSEIGQPVTEMRYGNYADFRDSPGWMDYSPFVYNWRLLETPYGCSWEYVYAQFRDEMGHESQVYNDVIKYDSYLTASMVLNGGNEYTNREFVMVNSEDLDSMAEEYSCSGLEDMALWEEGLTQTVWISYHPDIYFFLAPRDPLTGTARVYAKYRDRADNAGVFSDTIAFDLFPPYSGTTPTLNMGVPTTTELLVTVSDLYALDDESGVANIWLANRANGPWRAFDYQSPPQDYVWNLAYGGPPTQSPDLHTVYLRYEDGAGYGSLPGNFSSVYCSSLSVSGISSVYLPLVVTAYRPVDGAGSLPAPRPAQLLLLAEPQQPAPGEEVLLWLAARREADTPLNGTLQLDLPEGLHLLRAWSAYGELLQWDEQQVISRERISNRLTPWILVQARVEEDAATLLQVEGTMSWSGGSVEAVPLQLGASSP